MQRTYQQDPQTAIPFLAHSAIFQHFAQYLSLPTLSRLAITSQRAERHVIHELFRKPELLLRRLSQLTHTQLAAFIHAHQPHTDILKAITVNEDNHAAYVCLALMGNMTELDIPRLTKAMATLHNQLACNHLNQSIRVIIDVRNPEVDRNYLRHTLKQYKQVYINLSGMNLSGLDLSKMILSHCNLRHAILAKANLSSSVLAFADCENTDWTETNLEGAILYELSLTHTEKMGESAKETLTILKQAFNLKTIDDMLNIAYELYRNARDQDAFRKAILQIFRHKMKRQEATTSPQLMKKLYKIAIRHPVFSTHRHAAAFFGAPFRIDSKTNSQIMLEQDMRDLIARHASERLTTHSM